MIFYNHDREVITDFISYLPKTCFIMTQFGSPLPEKLKAKRVDLCQELSKREFFELDANSTIKGRDFLSKIWRQVLGVPFDELAGEGIIPTNQNVKDVNEVDVGSISVDNTFDGTNNIKQQGEFKVITFNDSGNIEDKPNKKYVKHTAEYFPGTLISAKILIKKDEIL